MTTSSRNIVGLDLAKNIRVRNIDESGLALFIFR